MLPYLLSARIDPPLAGESRYLFGDFLILKGQNTILGAYLHHLLIIFSTCNWQRFMRFNPVKLGHWLALLCTYFHLGNPLQPIHTAKLYLQGDWFETCRLVPSLICSMNKIPFPLVIPCFGVEDCGINVNRPGLVTQEPAVGQYSFSSLTSSVYFHDTCLLCIYICWIVINLHFGLSSVTTDNVSVCLSTAGLTLCTSLSCWKVHTTTPIFYSVWQLKPHQ